jgi:hypothetical protein
MVGKVVLFDENDKILLTAGAVEGNTQREIAL